MQNLSINQERQQQINRTLVIELLRKEKLCSRAQLANLSGLKRATITNIINEFIECGIVIEEGLLLGCKGRRSIGIRINGECFKVIGVMITRKSYQIGIMGLDDTVYRTEKFLIPEGKEKNEIIEEVNKNIKKMMAENEKGDILAIGLAIPGPYKKEDDQLVFITNLVGFDGINILAAIQAEFEIPVFIENDANAGVYAQQCNYDKTSVTENMVYIVAGEGIGCGIISRGELLKGAMGIAGEMGHCSINFNGPQCECGNKGCLETYCSLSVLLKNIEEQILEGKETILQKGFTVEELKRAVRQEDRVAVEAYNKVCRLLSVGIVNVINQENPSIIILGDALVEIHPERLLHIVKENVKQLLRPIIWNQIQIETNQLPYNPILIGAGAIAAKEVFQKPFSFVNK